MFRRPGWYFLNSSMPISVGNKILYYRQKIHSSHPDFEKIDVKYFVSYLVHESQVPMGEWGLYIEFDGGIPSYTKVDNEVYIKGNEPVKEEKKSEPVVKLPEGKVKIEKTKKVEQKEAHVFGEAESETKFFEGNKVEAFVEPLKKEEVEKEAKPKRTKKKTKEESPE